MTGGGWIYGAIFVASAFLSLVLTPVALRVALRRDIVDRPGGHKTHTSPVPYLGGTAIVAAFSAAVATAALVKPPRAGTDELLAILGIAVGLSVLGLVDDLRGLNVFLRLAAELGAAVAVYAAGVRVDLGPDWVNALVTVVWVVGVTNSLNLLDNMDGLSAGVASIAAAWLFVIAAASGQFLVAGLAAALAGCAAGFLRHNFHPARIYMGDAGSLFLGFTLSVLAIKLRFDGPTEITFFVPILVLGVALFDTTLVTVARLAHGRNPLSGGRDHTSHRLVRVGLPVRGAVGLIYTGAVTLGWLALIMSRVDRGTGFILMSLVLSLAALFGVVLGTVPVYDNSTRRLFALREVERHEVEPEHGVHAALGERR
jgi:UDP-GlcNAc:undecaprenyl-phosphate GlcNAc-1-phosphate transferase